MNESINITGIGVFLVLTLTYLGLTQGKIQPRASLYGIGSFIVLLVQVLPLHTGGFPAHMTGHILLLLVSAPLLVLGFPTSQQPGAAPLIERIAKHLQQRPWIGWLAGLGVMWFWHIPAVFNAAFAYEHAGKFGVSFLNSLSLIVGGMLFCWPILGPLKQYRINPLVGIIYLFTACMGCSLLGLFITFAPTGLYAYAKTVAHAGFIETLCGNWGTEQANEQQIAGLIMWVPCCFIYLSGAMYLLRSWLLDKEDSLSDSKSMYPITNPTHEPAI